MRKSAIFVLVGILLISFSVMSYADATSKSASGTAYPNGPIQKAERGFNNALFGWTEIPKRIVDKTKETNPIKGLLIGTYQGVLKAFARTASGLSEVATFPIASYDKPAVDPDMPVGN